MKSIFTSLSKIALAIIRPVLLFLTALFLPLNLNATSLWVGEKYSCDATSATMGNLYNISWSCNGGYINMTGSGLYRDIVITQYFNGEATVRCEWDYTLYYGDNFHHQTKTWTFSCRDNPVSISPEYMTLSVGETDYVGYRHQYSNSYTSYANAYFSCTSDVVSVTRDGEITANRPGTAYVYVYSNISSVSPYCTVTVKDYIPPTNIHIPATLSLNIDDTYQIKPTFEPSDAYSKLSWTSNNSTVASVDNKGVVTAKKLGTATIKVTTDNGLSAECLVSVVERDFSDGAVFRAKNKEGLDMFFKVISGKDKTCQVGADSIAVDKDYNGIITIPESVYGLTVTEIGYHAFATCRLTEVIIPNSVKAIKNAAFYMCFPLEKVHLPESLESIGSQAFLFCGISKYNFTIPNSVYKIGYDAFGETTWYSQQPNGLVYAGLVAYKYKGDMPANTTINLLAGTKGIAEDAFLNQTNLFAINIPNSVVYIGPLAFRGCSRLSSINLPDKLSSIEQQTFQSCTALSNITIPNNVLNIGAYAFQSCISLSKISIPNNVLVIGSGAFQYCNNASTLEIGNSVKIIASEAFKNCLKLKNVVIPNSVDSIGSSAFYGCTNLCELTIGEHLNKMGICAFADCESLKTLNYNAESCTFYTSYWNGYNTPFRDAPITTINIGDNVKSLPDYFGYGFKQLNSIYIPRSVERIGRYAFSGCSNLSKVDISDISSWCDIDFSAPDCNPLEYAKCLYLNGVEIKDLVIPNNVKSVKQYVFNRCESLINVIVSDGVTSLGDQAFTQCINLKEIDLPNSIVSIGRCSFYNCKSLLNINIPPITTIEDYTFYHCSNLKNVVIPNSVKHIAYNAFYYCDSLSSVDIGNSVQFIGNYAFYGMKNLTNVMCRSTNPPQCESTSCFGYYSSSGETNYPNRLFVPKGSIENYRNAEVWKNFSIIEEIDINENGDVNGDGEVNIADINTIINMILSK